MMKKSSRIFVDDTALIADTCVLDCGRMGTIKIGHRSRLKHGAIVHAMGDIVEIGQRVSIGEYCYLAGHGGLAIGDFTIIAPHCTISAAQHIFTEKDTPIRFQGESAKGIQIGKNVWIGANCVILDGVNIGEGSVVGAGAVVSRNVPPMSVVCGVPARVVRSR